MVRRRSPFFLKVILVLVAVVALAYLTRSLWLPVAGFALIHSESPAKADIGVVLAGDFSGHRIEKAAQLVKAGYVPEVLVNLSTAGGNERTQYLKVKVVLELPDQEMSAQIQPVMPRLLDTFQTYLRELRPTDLDGSAGLYRLKEELTRRVNASIAPNRINAVLFKEIVVQ